jgi:hypothetical protein
MSDENGTTSTDAAEDANGSNPPAPAAPEAPLGDGGISALKKERAARHEAEKRARTLEEKIASYERRDLAREVTTARGLPVELADRLRGSTREELDADAEVMASLFAPSAPPARPSTGRPKEKLRSGAASSDAAPEADLQTILDAIPRRDA